MDIFEQHLSSYVTKVWEGKCHERRMECEHILNSIMYFNPPSFIKYRILENLYFSTLYLTNNIRYEETFRGDTLHEHIQSVPWKVYHFPHKVVIWWVINQLLFPIHTIRTSCNKNGVCLLLLETGKKWDYLEIVKWMIK